MYVLTLAQKNYIKFNPIKSVCIVFFKLKIIRCVVQMLDWTAIF